MAEQNKRQGERQSDRQSESPARQGGGGERGLAGRQYHDPFSAFEAMFDRMQRQVFGPSLFSSMLPFGGGGPWGGDMERVPRIEVENTADALVIGAEMPGLKPEEIKVECDGDVLTLRGEKRQKEERDDTRTERYVRFFRQIQLPDEVDTEGAQASYDHGVLSLRFPKRTQRANAREIPISSGQQETGGKDAERAA
jgi:HSP20 family protein